MSNVVLLRSAPVDANPSPLQRPQSDAHPVVQRRCYWMLDGDDSIVLVHYLAGNSAARLHAAKARAAASAGHAASLDR